MTLVFVTTFLATFVFMFLRAFQQRNVAFNHYWWIVPTSLAMSFVEVFVIAKIAETGYHFMLVLSVGLGSGIGALSAALVHKKFLGREG